MYPNSHRTTWGGRVTTLTCRLDADVHTDRQGRQQGAGEGQGMAAPVALGFPRVTHTLGLQGQVANARTGSAGPARSRTS